jgi:hypothetical protein
MKKLWASRLLNFPRQISDKETCAPLAVAFFGDGTSSVGTVLLQDRSRHGRFLFSTELIGDERQIRYCRQPRPRKNKRASACCWPWGAAHRRTDHAASRYWITSSAVAAMSSAMDVLVWAAVSLLDAP